METFDSVSKAFKLDPAAMMRLMRDSGMEADVTAEFTSEQVAALYSTLQSYGEETEYFPPEGGNQQGNDESDDESGAEEFVAVGMIDGPENGEQESSDDADDDSSEEVFNGLTGEDTPSPEIEASEDSVTAEELMRKLRRTEEEFTRLLDYCGITLAEDRMIFPDDQYEIGRANYILYGKKIGGGGGGRDPDAPIRPLVSSSVPPEEYLDTEYDITAGSQVYRRDGSRDIPYVLAEGVSEGEGAEGTVYTVKNKSNNPPANENLVAKIYAPEYRTKRREAKIRAMIRAGLMNDSICLPVAVLTDKDGIFAGYLMKKARGMKLSAILDKLTKHEPGYFFSGWKRNNIAELIISILKGVKFLHDNNILIGDISADNIMAASSSEVYFVDTDSFQILSGGASLECLTDDVYLRERQYRVSGFPCAGDRVKYNSPEYQEALREYESSEIFRTKGDELFALAVLLFEILMMGKWPYDKRGMPPMIEAKKRRQFFYPSFFLTRRMISDNRTESVNGIPKFGLVNLPEGYIQMWDHLRPDLKRAFRDTFAANGRRISEQSRLTADEWLNLFTVYSNDLKWWADSDHDPANSELFPALFYKPKYKRDKNGEYVRTEDGRKVEIHYTECRLCHDRVDADECSGKNHDECSLCWDEGTKQICEKCGVEFIIKRQEAENANKSGNTLRRLCDDCMGYSRQCSEGHSFRVSRRVDDELYWKFRDSLWLGVARDDRDYSPYCPVCLDVVRCEICREPITLSKQMRYNMEKRGEPFSKICQHCMSVVVKCEECGCEFEVQKHIQDDMIAEGRPFSEICPENPETEAACERCGHVFTLRKHVHDRLAPEGLIFTECPKGETVQVECVKCGPGKTYGIEAYWAEELQARGEAYDCGKHKKLGIFGSSGSVEPSVNHRENP